jgi:predicted butyrate kinase (DUF1464 family)
MPRAIGIDPGTMSIDVCGLVDGEVYLDRSWPTADALAAPSAFVEALRAAGPPDLVVAPSGYGLPLRRAVDAGEDELRLAFLGPPGEAGGIGGLRRFTRELAAAGLPLVYLPGLIHLDTVPVHRKLNRVDLGTADKLCAAALGVRDQAARLDRPFEQVSFILLELGGAFTAAVAVHEGRIVDGVGGTSGPIGWRAAGALDGEVAYLAGTVTKAALFRGGVETVGVDRPAAIEAYVEGAVKAVHGLLVTAPAADEVLLSGRIAGDPEIRARVTAGLAGTLRVRALHGFAGTAKQGAQGAALLADGLAGGRERALVDHLRIREAHGTVLDHLYFIAPEVARQRLGLSDAHAG